MKIWVTVVAIILGSVGVGVVIGFATTPPAKLCDKAVERLFHSDDFIEIERSKFLVQYLGCRVTTRVPADYMSPDAR